MTKIAAILKSKVVATGTEEKKMVKFTINVMLSL